MLCDDSLLKSLIGNALTTPLNVLSYHLIVGNLEHDAIQEHLSHGIFDVLSCYVLHSSILIDKGFGPSMVAMCMQ